MTNSFPIAFKRQPSGKALLRLRYLLGGRIAAMDAALGLSDEEAQTLGRDVLFDLIEHLCVDDDDFLVAAAQIAISRLDFSQVRNGSA
jgi:hypothetical protein